jgi:hypothetical protein
VTSLGTSGVVTGGEAAALLAPVTAAAATLEREAFGAARNQLNAFINQADAFRRSRRLPADTATELIETAVSIIDSM